MTCFGLPSDMVTPVFVEMEDELPDVILNYFESVFIGLLTHLSSSSPVGHRATTTMLIFVVVSKTGLFSRGRLLAPTWRTRCWVASRVIETHKPLTIGKVPAQRGFHWCTGTKWKKDRTEISDTVLECTRKSGG